jgi:hypothetical protein
MTIDSPPCHHIKIPFPNTLKIIAAVLPEKRLPRREEPNPVPKWGFNKNRLGSNQETEEEFF